MVVILHNNYKHTYWAYDSFSNLSICLNVRFLNSILKLSISLLQCFLAEALKYALYILLIAVLKYIPDYQQRVP